MSVPRSRILDLMKVQCRIFSHTFNPEGLRLGNKILRQRLRGPALVSYYPRKMATYKDLEKAYGNEFPLDVENYNEPEEERLEKIKILKARGKGAPKKRRTGADSKKFKGGKKK